MLSFEEIYQYSAAAQLVLDPIENCIIDCNNETCRIMGASRNEVTQWTASRLFLPSFPDLISFSDEVIEKGRGWSNDLIINTPNGSIRIEASCRHFEFDCKPYLLMSIHPADDIKRLREQSDAEQHFLSGFGHWNRVNQVFREFERKNQLILDAVGEGIYGVDSNGTTTFVNPAAERMLDFKAEELVGKNMHHLIHHSHADGSHFVMDNCPIFRAFKDGEIHNIDDDIFWTKSGKIIQVEYTSTPIKDNGFIIGAVIVFRDVTQKRSNEKKILEAMLEVEQLKNQLQLENEYLQEELGYEYNAHEIVGKSPAAQNILKQVSLVAPTDATVLISGESGTGKELIARAIHEASQRSHHPLIRVNCAAIPDELFESEFFGHKRGSFTGANANRTGRFELANGGTLFLDEVGEIPIHLQGKLLRVLQEQQFEKIGESSTRNVDVRIIAATNQDLRSLIKQGKFREDLFFRLNVFPIESIPLRQRQADIPLLTQHFLKRACERSKKPNLKISLSELEKLKAYSWPGNIRELENIIERQVILSRGDTVRFENILVDSINTMTSTPITIKSVLTNTELREQERRNLIFAMESCQGKVFGKDGAAELIGIKPTTLTSKLKKFAIDPNDFKSSISANH